jgi:cell division protein ZapE
MHFTQHYHHQLGERQYATDPDQAKVVHALQALSDELDARAKSNRWPNLWGSQPETLKGLYIWGGVGRGKTWLMDLFYDHLAEPRKTRLHFHRFMQRVHADLTRWQGKRNPLKHIAKHMKQEWNVLCLDEFQVKDIGDAVILAGLLRSLFDQGIVLVTTSNVAPENLYQDGIQRASFLSAIKLLQEHTQVLPMGGLQDYRQNTAAQTHLYHSPITPETPIRLEEQFTRLASTRIQQTGILPINGRPMPYHKLAGEVVWFDFEALCGPPRSQQDYIELARRQHTVLLSDIPIMGASRDDRTRRFILLIDEFYDRKIQLIISAAAIPDKLYMGERLAFEFQRTISRLTEMQTTAYLCQTRSKSD